MRYTLCYSILINIYSFLFWLFRVQNFFVRGNAVICRECIIYLMYWHFMPHFHSNECKFAHSTMSLKHLGERCVEFISFFFGFASQERHAGVWREYPIRFPQDNKFQIKTMLISRVLKVGTFRVIKTAKIGANDVPHFEQIELVIFEPFHLELFINCADVICLQT